MEKLAFCSDAWFDMVAAEISALAADAPEPCTSFELSERYLDAPSHLTGDVGWSCRVVGRGVTFVARPSAEADLCVEVPYSLALMSLVDGGADPLAHQEHVGRLTAAALRDGRARVTGDREAVPALFQPLHGLLAARTSA